MDLAELKEIISRNEDGRYQFKANAKNETSIAQEIVAFSNSGGGTIFIGINDDGTFSGLTRQDMGRLNQLVSNAASQHVRPPVNPQTENIETSSGLVMKIVVPNGVSKPYMDKDGVIWVKSGSDKRKATSREEIQRLYQSVGLVHGDEVPVPGLGVEDLDRKYFEDFFERNFAQTIEEQKLPLTKILENMNLLREGNLNVSGALLFAKNPSFKLPVFIVKAVAFPGTEITEKHYIDSRDLSGKLEDVYSSCMSFALANIRHVQGDKSVNSIGDPEIPRITLEEIIANALIHRDYFISAPIRLFVFSDRVEIVSPGHLPNNLTIENIKRGNSNIRNPILASYATKIIPYRGLGSGIVRALKEYPDIEFENDRDGNQFRVTIKRAPLDVRRGE